MSDMFIFAATSASNKAVDLMKAEVALSIVGSSLTAISIIIVYVMFSLQIWIGKANDALDQASYLSKKDAPGTFERNELEQATRKLKDRFPMGQVVIFGIAVILLCGTSIHASFRARADLDLLYSLTPILILFLAYAFSCISIFLKGGSIILEALNYLSSE